MFHGLNPTHTSHFIGMKYEKSDRVSIYYYLKLKFIIA